MVEMIDWSHLNSYRENNRIEAKKSLGGLPRSLWETYSSFANTFGGVLLLGVEEKKDKSFLVHNLPEPEALVEEFWQIITDKQCVSENILRRDQVQILSFEGKRFIAIFVPRAKRGQRPIYIGMDAYTGSYRRDGEGDYHCSRSEVDAMLLEAGEEEEDFLLLEEEEIGALDQETLKRYRRFFGQAHPGHIWLKLDEKTFLEKICAAGRDEEGKLHPTAAGLLMFGRERSIVKRYPCYALYYQELLKDGIRETVCSSDDGDWSGNLFDFYVRTYQRINDKIRIPEKFRQEYPHAMTPIHRAISELLVNCLAHADYREKQGVVVLQSKGRITFENPGCFGVDKEEALKGGEANPIHPLLIQMFHLVGLGNGEGRGISKIYALWKKCGFALPKITEQDFPKRTQIVISVRTRRAPVAVGSEFRRIRRENKPVIYESLRQQVIDYVTVNREVHTGELAELLDMELPRVKQLLAQMVKEGVLETAGGMGNLSYRLKQ